MSLNEFINHKYHIHLYPNGEGARIEGDQNIVDVAMDFLGWARSAAGDVAFSDGQYVKNLTSTNNDTIDLYAKWADVGHVILPAPIRPTYYPTGWFTAPTGGTKKSDIGAEYTVYVNEDLYAQWRPIKYSVVFSGNGSTSGGMYPQQMEYIHDSSNPGVALTANEYVKKSTVTFDPNGGETESGEESEAVSVTHTFQKWNTKANGTGTVYNNRQVVKNLASTENAKFYLYAQWNTLSVTLIGAKMFGHSFGGWMNGDEFVGTKGETYAVKQSVTLTAKWETYKYNVKFNANGGRFDTGNPTLHEKQYEHGAIFHDSDIETPKYTGKIFGGWFTQTKGGTKLTDPDYFIGADNDTNNPNYSPTFYAQWMTTVTFDDNDYNLIWKMNDGQYYMRYVSDQKVPKNYMQNESDNDTVFDRSKIDTIAVRSDIETIGDSAFKGTGVIQLKLEDTLKTIDNRAFFGCANLQKINVPGKTGNVVIPNSVTRIGEKAFIGCHNNLYQTITVGTGGTARTFKCVDGWIVSEVNNTDKPLDFSSTNAIRGICDTLFRNTEAKTLNTGNGMRYIGDYAFEKSELTTVAIGANVERIGNNAFQDCS